MFQKLPSLLDFQPKFYSGSEGSRYLPLLYDLMATEKPKTVVVLGFGDGQAFFTFCQAAREGEIAAQCAAVRRADGEDESDDSSWREGIGYGSEFYGDLARFVDGRESDAPTLFPDAGVDLILIDDSDSGRVIQKDLCGWAPKLAPDALVLCHGIELEREDSPKAAWREWAASRPLAEFSDGIGLGLTTHSVRVPNFVLKQLFAKESRNEIVELYRLVAARIDAQARADETMRAEAALKVRLVWLDGLLADRWKVQEIMDHQTGAIADLERRFDALLSDRKKAQDVMEWQAEHLQQFEALRRDRAKAQLVMDSQREQLNHWEAKVEELKAEKEQLKAKIKEQKRILNAANQACRKKGRCFRIPTGPKQRRPMRERILREIRRIPRNLGITRAPNPVAPAHPAARVIVEEPLDRYAAWIAEHEPDAEALEKQRTASAQWAFRPKISLLVPVYNTPGNFLAQMMASVSAQSYENWELCLVDGGSDAAETVATLEQWATREPRIRLERLEKNNGISENTNRALTLATGDCMACADHDDLLAPFALYELARAINEFPRADIFYSDEDRCRENGDRHSPFFKPEWDPELLCSFMYIGHLTAYRRSLVEKVGAFRKEYDLSQDYDFALRAAELAEEIRHIPHVLYHWREHPISGSAGGKPNARKSNLAALEDAMSRRHLAADILEYPTANRARLRPASWPRVSIIVPTDSPSRAMACARDLPRKTEYPDLEIVLVTNSGLAESLKGLQSESADFQTVPYDEPFNFSDKCNRGAAAASGDRLIFFNDDVQTEQPDWIQNLIEPLENPQIGAVAPKLLYETGRIQHAGLVLGVRGLIGTAFHERAADSTEHFNLAQSLRNVAALSAACLAMRRDDFTRVGGFDAVNTPIAHSDVDLSFRVRAAGLRCVYTPYATLTHPGRGSIAVEDERVTARDPDKGSIYLLKRWPHYTTRDPYFTDNMRDWLYTDSPTPIRIAAPDQVAPGSSYDLLFVSHDLSLSGAPMMLLHAARWCRENGMFVVVMAPKDGPLREMFEVEAIPLIIDPLVKTGHKSFVLFARDFDCVVANTICSWAAVSAMQGQNVPTAWWLHEPASVGEHYIAEDSKLRATLPLADVLITPSQGTAALYRPFSNRPMKCVRNAIPDLALPEDIGRGIAGRPLRFLLLGSIEPRKGQDTFVQAIAMLPHELQQAAEFEIAGRILDPAFWARVKAISSALKNFSVRGALDHAQAIGRMRNADVIISASRDEAMPTVTILEAMSLGKALIATTAGRARDVLTEGENAFLVKPEAPEALAAALRRLIENPALVPELGQQARATYEKNFTMARFGKEFHELLDALIYMRSSTRRGM